MEHRLQTLNAAQRVQIWAERIAECRSSGKSVRAWCRENEMSEKTYYYWQRRLYQQMISAPQRVDFAEIPREIHTGQSTGVPGARTGIWFSASWSSCSPTRPLADPFP